MGYDEMNEWLLTHDIKTNVDAYLENKYGGKDLEDLNDMEADRMIHMLRDGTYKDLVC